MRFLKLRILLMAIGIALLGTDVAVATWHYNSHDGGVTFGTDVAATNDHYSIDGSGTASTKFRVCCLPCPRCDPNDPLVRWDVTVAFFAGPTMLNYYSTSSLTCACCSNVLSASATGCANCTSASVNAKVGCGCCDGSEPPAIPYLPTLYPIEIYNITQDPY